MNGPENNLDRKSIGGYRSNRSLYLTPRSAGRGSNWKWDLRPRADPSGASRSRNTLDELRDGGWRKLIFRRWKIIYTIRGDAIIIGRVWPAAMGEADLETPL